VTNQELADFLCAADIYVTPYLNMQQSTSGTLAYAVGGGRAVISTPYRHAVELLADGRGVLVPRADSAAIASEVIELLSNDEKRAAIGRQAAMYGADKLWPTVGRRYVQAFERARAEHRTERRRKHSARTLQAPAAELLATRYLAFVSHAYDPTSRRFRNFMTYTRQWVAAPPSDDCHGRAIWALGTVVGRSEERSRVNRCRPGGLGRGA
jgi:hypothetical protein